MVAFNKSISYTLVKGDIMKNFIEKFKEKQRESNEKTKKYWEEAKRNFTKEGSEEIEREIERKRAIAKERYERYLLGDKTIVLTKWEIFKFRIWPILSKVLKVLIFVVIFGAILLGYTCLLYTSDAADEL